MSEFTAEETLRLMEDLGRQRAAKNRDIVERGEQPEDYLEWKEEGVWVAIHDPWLSECGRFEVENPYKEYGRPFTEWLMRPFYNDQINILRRITTKPSARRTQIHNPNKGTQQRWPVCPECGSPDPEEVHSIRCKYGKPTDG